MPVWLSSAVAADPEIARLVVHAKTMRSRGHDGFEVENETWECGTLRIFLGFNRHGGQVVYEFVKAPELHFRLVPSYIQGWKKAEDGGFQWS